MLLLLSSRFSVIGRAHSGSTGCFRLLQYFSVDVTVESIFCHWSDLLGFNWRLSFAPEFQCWCDCRVYFPSLVGPTWVQRAVSVCSSISALMLLSSLFSVIGRALSGSTGSFRLLQFFSVDVTVDSIFRHWSGPLGISWLFSFVIVFQCCCFC